jgi:hypothetical protein
VPATFILKILIQGAGDADSVISLKDYLAVLSLISKPVPAILLLRDDPHDEFIAATVCNPVN